MSDRAQLVGRCGNIREVDAVMMEESMQEPGSQLWSVGPLVAKQQQPSTLESLIVVEGKPLLLSVLLALWPVVG